MKLQLPLITLFALSLAACDDGTSTTSTTTDTMAVAPAADPGMVTTTTARPAFTPKPNVQYMDLRTRKLISVRVDTVHHYIVNAENNQPVEWIIEPGTTDTFYGRNMQMANGYINYGSGSDWTYDESRANSADMSGADIEKMKSNDNETKIKMEDGSKIKTNDNETKIKTSDGSKIKSNDNETKVKNK